MSQRYHDGFDPASCDCRLDKKGHRMLVGDRVRVTGFRNRAMGRTAPPTEGRIEESERAWCGRCGSKTLVLVTPAGERLTFARKDALILK